TRCATIILHNQKHPTGGRVAETAAPARDGDGSRRLPGLEYQGKAQPLHRRHGADERFYGWVSQFSCWRTDSGELVADRPLHLAGDPHHYLECDAVLASLPNASRP